ncbi:MAG: diguanylate cyclase [Pseudomonadales bacterium]|nr:diguanylate cyclase [Pseudomonadales bacterium]
MTNSELTISDYRAQMAMGFRFLVFEEKLEAHYRELHRRKHRSKQLATIAVAIVILLLVVPVDIEYLPQPLIPVYFLLRLGLSIPILLFVTACHYMEDLRKHIHKMSIVAVLSISFTTIALYILSAQVGHRFPYEGLLIIFMVTFFMSGLHFWTSLGCVVTTLAVFELCFSLFIPTGPMFQADAFYLLATALSGAIGAYSVEYQKRKGFLQHGIVTDLATKDGLTGLLNRTVIMEKLEALLNYARREEKYLTLYLADIDCFKEYNDNYGHIAGDKSLKKVAASLNACCQRNLDFAGRYGGEEFLLVWFDTDPQESNALINRVQKTIHDLNIPHAHSAAADHLTVSGGFICLIPHADTSVESLLHQVDMALYNAKRRGRNQVSQVATPETV